MSSTDESACVMRCYTNFIMFASRNSEQRKNNSNAGLKAQNRLTVCVLSLWGRSTARELTDLRDREADRLTDRQLENEIKLSIQPASWTSN